LDGHSLRVSSEWRGAGRIVGSMPDHADRSHTRRLLGQAILAGLVATAVVLTIIACQPEHVPAEVQRQLPLLTFFSGLCPGSSTTPAERRQVMRQADVLIHELRRRPNELVTIEDSTFADGHEPHDISVRELAERRRQDLTLERERTGRDCAPQLRHRLTGALKNT
jgi:hypothetical protein